MKKRYWFKAKTVGWGWTPATWQGWLITAIFVLYLIGLSVLIGTHFESRAGMTSFLFLTALGTMVLVVICYLCGEEPKWRFPKKNQPKRST